MLKIAYNAKVRKTQLDYFPQFLHVTPMALALYRSGEAAVLNTLFPNWQEPVVDIGCGFGEFMGVYYNGQIEVGVDINRKDLAVAARTKKYGRCRVEDARNLSFASSSIQTVASISVLEHIPHVEQAFEEIYRILKPGGHIVFTVPTNLINNYLWVSIACQHLGLNPLAHTYIHHFHRVFKHVNLWPSTKWLRICKQAGFTILECRPTLTVRELHLFEAGLLPSLPSQITRNLFGKRFVVDFSLRQRLFKHLLRSVIAEKPRLPLNVAVIGVKP